MPTESDGQGGPRFHAARPTDLRAATPWHRLRHIVRELPAGLEELSRELGAGAESRILDLGSADSPYRRFFAPTAHFVAADLPGNPDADVTIAPDGTVPLPDEAFDVVLSTQVLEHVADPGVYLAECLRVLRPGGRMLLSTHGLMVWHPDPVDLWRWTSEGLRRAVGDAGFRIVRFEGIMGLAATGLQLVQDSVYWRLPRPLAAALALILQSLIALADRLQGPEAKRMNALVFALVAEKPRPLAAPGLLAAFAEVHPEATFVEIGSNDGEQHDHLRAHVRGRPWRGLMVEPVPYVFERLRRNLGDLDRVELVRAAVADRDGTVPFFHLVEPPEDLAAAGLPDWYDGIGSLSEAHVLEHARHVPDLERRIVRTEVPARTYASLLAEHGIERVDLLVIDAEGHDWAILRTVDLHEGPRVIVYEHFHLTPEDRDAARRHVEAAGYATIEEGFDTWCLRPGPGDALDDAWARAVPGVPGVSVHEEPR